MAQLKKHYLKKYIAANGAIDTITSDDRDENRNNFNITSHIAVQESPK